MKQWSVILSLFLSISAFAEQPPIRPPQIWVIAHMTNSTEAVDWAADEGANGVEADLHFDEKGEPAYFRHSEKKLIEPCDCSCFDKAPNMEVCKHLKGMCLSKVGAAEWFDAVVTRSEQLGLVVIDSKVDKHTAPTAGRNLIRALASKLFDRKYNGMVVIGASDSTALPYLHDAAEAAAGSEYADRIYFTLDGGGSHTVEVLNDLVKLPSRNIVYGTGVSACWLGQFPNAILLGEANRRAGVIGFNYIWTIDKPDSMRLYMEKGAGGIMTNDPRTAVRVVTKERMAKPGHRFPAATSDEVVTTTPQCDCNYGQKGCVINQKKTAPPDWACKCEEAELAPWTCYGSVVVCKDPASKPCLGPTADKPSCEQGGGNCNGYRQ